MNEVNYLCDTNILINLYHADSSSTVLCEGYFDCFNRVGFVEPVHHELLRTPELKNESRKETFVELYNRLDSKYYIFFIDDLDDLTKQAFIDEMLLQGYSDYKGINGPQDNVGEIATLILAHLIDIPLIHTNDQPFMDFVEENRDIYSDVVIVTLREVLDQLISDDKQRIRLTATIEENSRIFKERIKNQKSKEEMNLKLEQLKNKFSKR